MNKLIASILLVVVVVVVAVTTPASAFTAIQPPSSARSSLASPPTRLRAPLGPHSFGAPPAASSSSSSSAAAGTTATALYLKVKIDPNAKGNKNVAGNARMAAYGGSVVIALMLPIAFLVWSAVSK